MNVEAALAAAARIGPFFRVRPLTGAPPGATGTTGPMGSEGSEGTPGAEGAGSPLAGLYAGGPALDTRVRATGRALGVRDPRVAGSIFFQGLAARLWSPALAVAVLHGRVLRLPPDVTWLDESGLACARPSLDEPAAPESDPAAGPAVRPATSSPGTALAPALADAVVEEHLAPLAAALDVPATVIWGNAASALVGSYRVLAGAQPTPAAVDLVRALLATHRLSETGELDRTEQFQRNSCCLFYRVPGGGLCGDCVLHRSPRHRPPGPSARR